ncbi:biliverdin-producing heme oxygenase [Mucilaginibacter sp. AK015]|uniref:biliverdin-producing heme oxygenase n=1 Tax=Mucilaginibacter sp. AK015 TaxID=2723072 RepID=UPI0016084037|nr:biliverdin-producing heme oxygenase [Mucilaginibacter sp. AK015]MBB5397203.1 heme oxygenase [Mucilaginibacter sp. AK015]
MLSDKLKEETKKNHQVLEKALIGHLRAIRSVSEYITLLQLFYGYFGGLEMLMDKAIDDKSLVDSTERRKTQAIANDILILGGTVPAIATGYNLPAIHSHLQALGALYVIEGSTLGGKIISKMIQQQLGTDMGLSFFAGYGDKTDEMWASFKNVLDTQCHTPEQEAVVTAAANETFSKFYYWFNKAPVF